MMKRKGVPGMDCLCEIKEKLRALYDRTHACILRINGKTPDGNGDITIDLSDAIPGRYVESVNGQDGNVIVNKASVGLSNVDNVSSSYILTQADLTGQARLDTFEAQKLDPVELEVAANTGRIVQLEGQQVVLDDKMEQTIQYADAIGDDVAEIKDAYVDKTTTQYITGKKYVPTPTSADYSGMIVNKAFVETTDPDLRENNLMHIIAAENVNGTKTFLDVPYFKRNRPALYIQDMGFTKDSIPASESRFDLRVYDSAAAYFYSIIRMGIQTTSGDGFTIIESGNYDESVKVSLILYTHKSTSDVELRLRKTLNGVRSEQTILRF